MLRCKLSTSDMLPNNRRSPPALRKNTSHKTPSHTTAILSTEMNSHKDPIRAVATPTTAYPTGDTAARGFIPRRSIRTEPRIHASPDVHISRRNSNVKELHSNDPKTASPKAAYSFPSTSTAYNSSTSVPLKLSAVGSGLSNFQRPRAVKPDTASGTIEADPQSNRVHSVPVNATYPTTSCRTNHPETKTNSVPHVGRHEGVARSQKRKESHRARKRRKLESSRALASKAAGLDVSQEQGITVIRCKRNNVPRDTIKGRIYRFDDPIFTNGQHKWRRIAGKGSGHFLVLDADTGELVFTAKITENRDMDSETTACFQDIFDFFENDRQIHRPCSTNGAHLAGTMTAIGWRKAMVPGEAFGTYAPRNPGCEKSRHHCCAETARIHRIYSQRFKQLAPALQQHQVSQHGQMRVPGLGFGHEDEMIGEELFCSNLAYTRDGFENRGHCDSDDSTYTFGIGGNIRKDSRLASFKDGYKQTGGFLYIADYGFIIDYSKIDGVVEQVWQGPNHIHSTVGGKIREGFTRLGSSCQINKRLSKAVRSYLQGKNNSTVFVLDDMGRFKAAQRDA